ncbi:sodium-coupled monocarboxylate transporter 1-like [Chelonus insularis]|uniref:sodium-coupled monocarboxylate transporter 1-like n=1 Tax=Chelonus insularis TaxID=460826 RepID=UPI00158D5416|nr:sodium-coupled monocarboxylate transporter 1-like [Chelonus insularis]
MVESPEKWYFHWADWVVFGLMLCFSASAGIWHFRNAKKSTTLEYLLGGKSLGIFPVSASLIASFISGITILGTPAEIYNFGTQYWITIISLLFSGIIVSNVYLPVFMTLKLNSCYEYLEIRFNRAVRILISFIFVIDVVLYQSIVVYVPALALNQVSGISIHLIGGIVCFICVFYTVLGGIRAVVWTDAFQVGIMIAAVLTVTSLGTYQLGGTAEVWKRALDAKRIQFFNFDPSPYTRHTVWSVLIGSCLYSTSYISVNQTMVQRYSSLPTTKVSKMSLGIFTIGVMLFISLTCWCGLVLLAWWAPPECDPRLSGLVKTDDQMLPAYVMQIAGHLHGIPGLFIAGIFSAALSTLSVGLNSTSVVLLEDFVKGCFRLKPNDHASTIFVKTVVILLGLFAMGFLFVVERLGGVLAVTGSLAAIAAGTSFGVFTLGMLVPWANSKGAFVGAIAGFIISGWSSLGANAMIGTGAIIPKKLPIDLTYCPSNISESILNQFPIDHDEEDIFPLYRLSYHWFAGLGTVTVVLVGGIVTWITGPRNLENIDRDLFSPVIHRFLPETKSSLSIGEWSQRTSDSQAIPNSLNETSRTHFQSTIVSESTDATL